jgi:hypothetical protein
MTINRDFEGEVSVPDPPTHIPIESSWKEEYVVFSANLAARAVEKVIIDLQKLTRIVIFLLQKGVRQYYN